MSIKAMNWVWEHSRTIGNDRLLLLAIADRASDEGMDAWPSIKTLAKKTKLHERTVQRCLKNIEALGELEIRHSEGAHGTNVYIVRMDVLVLEDSRERRRVPAKRSTSPSDRYDPGNVPPGGNLPPCGNPDVRGGELPGGGVAPSPPGGGTVATGGVAVPPPDSSCTSCTNKTNTAAEPRFEPGAVENLTQPMRPETHLRLAKEPSGDGNYQVISKLAFALANNGSWQFEGGSFSIASESDLVLALKDECARLGIDRGNHPDVHLDVIHRAAASEWFKRTNPDISGRVNA